MMRRIVLASLAALSLVACNQDATGPVNNSDQTLDAGAFGTALTAIGGYEADLYASRLGNGLPDELRLTDAQRASIKALVDAFEQSTRADREAILGILRRAREAATAGKTRAEVAAILKEGDAIRARLATAQSKLKTDIDAVLTAEQRAWIASRTPPRCDASKFPPLTDGQKAQIRALEKSFADANAADIEAMRKLMEEAKAAAQAGKTREEIAAILGKGAPIVIRLTAARVTLRSQIAAVLTAEQKATGCFPLG
ncbi:MAG TPA: Spy/CpxP family protein refolding chaperone [Gemmatimonadaceae bacterium]|nr:Spy/CpxP family protein refolding chaperone [Gemmatimonadaceae bacterium]